MYLSAVLGFGAQFLLRTGHWLPDSGIDISERRSPLSTLRGFSCFVGTTYLNAVLGFGAQFLLRTVTGHLTQAWIPLKGGAFYRLCEGCHVSLARRISMWFWASVHNSFFELVHVHLAQAWIPMKGGAFYRLCEGMCAFAGNDR